jgi:hypothetical protein
MARGKHKSRSTNQRSINNEAILSQLRSELAMESAALCEAGDTLERISGLQSELSAANASLIEGVVPYASQLRQERDFLRSTFADVSSHHTRIQESWVRYTSAGFERTPGATRMERLESLNETMGFHGVMNNNKHFASGGGSVEALSRVQRARGERRNAFEGFTADKSRVRKLAEMLDLGAAGHAMILPNHRQRLFEQDIVFRDEAGLHEVRDPKDLTEEQIILRSSALDMAEVVWSSHAGDLNVDSVHVWGTGGIISSDGELGEQRRGLGFAAEKIDGQTVPTAGITTSLQLPLASTPAASRNALAEQRAEGALGAWRSVFESRRLVAESLGLSSHPFAPLVHHPHPAQGLALQNAYALAAFAGWIHHGPGSVYARAAIGLTAAATYWLPAGQTASFAESDPLNEADRAEMILPFPQVFLAFAEPLVLEPTISRSELTEEKRAVLSEVTHDLYRDNGSVSSGFEHAFSRTHPDLMVLPTVDEMLSEFGAHIEGVLLLADSLGRPEDRFAWCLTFPGAYGTTLGRFVVPALRSTTEYRDVVDNLTAVVAWAQWHEPDQSTDVPLGVGRGELDAYITDPDFVRNARRAGAGIRVVDVRATNRGASARASHDGEATEANVSPHIRRGHWRRQRFGHGLEQSKRIRIAPVLVNAYRGDIAHRVYRLRRSEKIAMR